MPQHFTKFELFYTPRFPLFFLTGMVLLAVMGNMLTDLLKHYLGASPWHLILIFAITALGLALLVAAAHAAGAIQKRLTATSPYVIIDRPKPNKCRGLIAFVSGREPEHLRKALKYHSPELQRAWLIATKETKSQAREIQHEYESDKLSIRIVDLDDQWDLPKAKAVVEKIYGDGLIGGLKEEDIIADFTGGTKPMSAGMIFACMNPSRKLQYVPADYSGSTPRPLDPIEYGLDAIREQTVVEQPAAPNSRKVTAT